MALHALADDLAGGDIERREQGRRSMALVIVGQGSGAPFLHRQTRLRAVERLDLALLVERKHQRLVRRVEVKPDDILDLLAEPRSFESLNRSVRCGFSPCAAQMRCTLEYLGVGRLGELARRAKSWPPAVSR